ncbi:hypothetical protein LXL04_037655 [Taraxacum kok-saghyz]
MFDLTIAGSKNKNATAFYTELRKRTPPFFRKKIGKELQWKTPTKDRQRKEGQTKSFRKDEKCNGSEGSYVMDMKRFDPKRRVNKLVFNKYDEVGAVVFGTKVQTLKHANYLLDRLLNRPKANSQRSRTGGRSRQKKQEQLNNTSSSSISNRHRQQLEVANNKGLGKIEKGAGEVANSKERGRAKSNATRQQGAISTVQGKVHWKYVSTELKIVVRAESARDNHRNDCKMLTKNLKAAFLVNDIDDELLELAQFVFLVSLRLTLVPSRDVSSAEENEDDAAGPAGDAVGPAGDAAGGAPGDDRGADA